MSKLKKLFETSERLTPRAGLWNEIEAKLGSPSTSVKPLHSWWEKPTYRLAASITLFAGILALGFMLKQVANTSVLPQEATLNSFVDSELIAWNADLGDVELQSDEEKELADKIFDDLNESDTKSEILN